MPRERKIEPNMRLVKADKNAGKNKSKTLTVYNG
jgi:hypothetical protein